MSSSSFLCLKVFFYMREELLKLKNKQLCSSQNPWNWTNSIASSLISMRPVENHFQIMWIAWERKRLTEMPERHIQLLCPDCWVPTDYQRPQIIWKIICNIKESLFMFDLRPLQHSRWAWMIQASSLAYLSVTTG